MRAINATQCFMSCVLVLCFDQYTQPGCLFYDMWFVSVANGSYNNSLKELYYMLDCGKTHNQGFVLLDS